MRVGIDCRRRTWGWSTPIGCTPTLQVLVRPFERGREWDRNAQQTSLLPLLTALPLPVTPHRQSQPDDLHHTLLRCPAPCHDACRTWHTTSCLPPWTPWPPHSPPCPRCRLCAWRVTPSFRPATSRACCRRWRSWTAWTAKRGHRLRMCWCWSALVRQLSV